MLVSSSEIPPKKITEKLFKSMFAINVNSIQAKQILSRTTKSLGDFRNKFSDEIEKLIIKYKTLRYSLYFSYFY